MDIIYRDESIIVCIKPAGVLSTDEPGGLPELLRCELGDEKGRRAHGAPARPRGERADECSRAALLRHLN